MSKLVFKIKKFTSAHLRIIAIANKYLEECARDGDYPTLRSVYYYFIATDAFPEQWIDPDYNKKNGLPPNTKNTVKNYKKLGAILGEARLSGLVDWDHIQDRTRNLMGLGHYANPQDAISSAASGYLTDLWANQKYRPEIWIEKDALVGMIQRTCNDLDVPYFSCRGYTSLSEMYVASTRLRYYQNEGKTPFIIHLGDHDPSGVDMTRDIMDRLQDTFMAAGEFRRIALTMEQVEKYRCPPNPAKVTDSRHKEYSKKFGEESWELDALKPATIRELIMAAIKPLIDEKQLTADKKQRDQEKKALLDLSAEWTEIPGWKKDLKKLRETEEMLRKENSEVWAARDELKKKLAEAEAEIRTLKQKKGGKGK